MVSLPRGGDAKLRASSGSEPVAERSEGAAYNIALRCWPRPHDAPRRDCLGARLELLRRLHLLRHEPWSRGDHMQGRSYLDPANVVVDGENLRMNPRAAARPAIARAPGSDLSGSPPRAPRTALRPLPGARRTWRRWSAPLPRSTR